MPSGNAVLSGVTATATSRWGVKGASNRGERTVRPGVDSDGCGEELRRNRMPCSRQECVDFSLSQTLGNRIEEISF